MSTEVHRAIGELGADDVRIVRAAEAELVRAGRAALDPLLQVLRAPASEQVERSGIAVLKELGPYAFRPLLERIAATRAASIIDPEAVATARRACRVLGFPETEHMLVLMEKLCSPDEDVRSLAVRYADIEYAPALVVMLSDPDPSVRQQAIRRLGGFGSDMVPLLRRVRRSRTVHRRGALAALAEIGWDTIEPDDLTAVHRLIRSKLAVEVPHPFAESPRIRGWYALPTDDQAAVLDAFALSDPVPVTLRMGCAAIESIYSQQSGCDRMFVTPALDGWTLIFGNRVPHGARAGHRRFHSLEPDVSSIDSEYMRMIPELFDHWAHCEELSRRFGAAHRYCAVEDYLPGDWLIMQAGEEISCGSCSDSVADWEFIDDEDPYVHGLRTESTPNWLAANGFPADMWDRIHDEILTDQNASATDLENALDAAWSRFQHRTGLPDALSISRIAARASISPFALTPDTPIQGHGVLALTACGRDRGGHHGAFPI
ncbi:HEAT repeat domain-containing protein [Nocardia macrotermitis]|uniref:HEAT repeat protein n=1 Tax=Nocardia macrotermitis TaxID=2585198 RepID=A0A7K0DC65_9NOCA|nr:HEAT repeat domain-containing protein [Nocardia macrotermitis]MQY22892.1 hypothetical protein [Nocardia macrotermitis]